MKEDKKINHHLTRIFAKVFVRNKLVRTFMAMLLAVSLMFGFADKAVPVDSAGKMSLKIKKTQYTYNKNSKGKKRAAQTIRVRNLSKRYKVKWKSGNKKVAAVTPKKGKAKAKLTVYMRKTGRSKITAIIYNKKSGKVVKKLNRIIRVTVHKKPTAKSKQIIPKVKAGEFSIAAVIKELCRKENGGRFAGTRGNRLAAGYIMAHFEKAGLKPLKKKGYEWSYDEHHPDVGNAVGNVVGYMKGRDSTKAIVVTAHFDTVLNTPGAFDNASGVAALLDVVYKLKKRGKTPETDIVFCAFNEEEQFYVGSAAFVNEFKGLYKKSININIDCVGHKNNGNYLLGYEKNDISADLIRAFQSIFNSRSIPYRNFPVKDIRSDHRSFQDEGIPNICFTQEGGIMHSAQDVISSVDDKLISKISDAMIEFIINNRL